MTSGTPLDAFAALALDWTGAYLIHSTVLLALTWAVTRFLGERRVALQEVLWRGALFGGLLTASLQVGGAALPAWGDPATALPPAATRELVAEAIVPALDATPLARPQADAGGAGARAPLTVPREAATIFLALWAAGAALGLGRLALAARRLARRVRGASPVKDPDLQRFVARLASAMGIARPVALLVSPQAPSPFAAGLRRPRIVLPAKALERLDADQRRSLLAHEAAHVARRDAAWLLAALVVERVFFFQPLNRLARIRLRENAEILADESAARHAGRGESLARCLVEVAGWRSGLVEAAAVMGAGAPPKALARRVERLLAGRRDGGRGPVWPVTLALLGAVALVPGVSLTLGEPAPEPPPAPPAPQARPAPEAVPAPEARPERGAEPAPPPAPRAPRAERARAAEELARLAREHRERVHELMEREEHLRARIEELAVRAAERGEDETAQKELERLQAELEAIAEERVAEGEKIREHAESLGARIGARERARARELAERQVRLEREHARAPRARHGRAAEMARLEYEIAILMERAAAIEERLAELAREEEAEAREDDARE